MDRRSKILLLLAAASSVVQGFLAPHASLNSVVQQSREKMMVAGPLHMNFFKDVLGKAFENDASLDTDKTKGQYDGPGDEMDDSMSVGRLFPPQELTETQKRWRDTQQQPGGTPQLLLTNSQWKLDLFLTGIPDRDPSNDLFASKVKISTRDRKVGLMVPEEPTVSDILVTLLEDGVCHVVSDSEFLNQGTNGAWKVSDDGQNVRISLDVNGYQRTVQTKGSIQKIYWSQEDETSVQTSTAYSIPAGPLFGDASLKSGAKVGTLQWTDGILRVEQSAGLLGAGSKMVPCGRFAAERVGTQQTSGVL
ncbi:expressed unknown protein [Seminavis robusta]|uniref:Uncharacterized protein n=1 Tax=Seminavis robusta TaxID=568900 RepID=A0A9N8HNG8_9STRA|nr:expressed unknown protein [Seminavis robusta]|eukprot:Sro1210_g252790.1 n/a (306) ;mRNA; f:26907-27824